MRPVTVLRFGALGDTLMLTPVFRYLVRHLGRPVGYAGKGPYSVPLLEWHPCIDGVRQIHSKRMPFTISRDQRRLVRWLHERRDGYVLDLEADAKSAALLRLADFPQDRIWRATGKPVPPEYRHQVTATLSRVRFTLEGSDRIEDLDTTLCMPVADAWRREVEDWLAASGWHRDELILIAPGNRRTMTWRPHDRASNRKHWPPVAWGRLCDSILTRRAGARVLVVGAPQEQRLAQAVVAATRSERVHAVAEDMSVPRLLALMARAQSAVTLDSGPSHAAAAVDCPVVTLFNATDPGRFMPLARSGRVRAVVPGGDASAQWQSGDIGVNEVFAAWRELTERRPVAPVRRTQPVVTVLPAASA